MVESPVSVIVLTRDRAAWTERAVRSVLAQSHQALELIVIDDGSRDDTLARLERLGDARLRLVAQAASGHIAALRQQGLELARHAQIAFLDSDDWWEPDHLARLLALLADNPKAAFAYANVQLESPAGLVLKERAYPESTANCLDRFADLAAGRLAIYSSSACVFRGLRGLAYDTRLAVGDHDFLVRLASAGPGAYSPACTVHICRHDDHLSDRMGARTYAEHRHTLRWCRQAGHFSSWQGYMLEADAAYRQGLGLREEGCRLAAVGCFSFSALHPRYALKAWVRIVQSLFMSTK
jgi:glycosyltransferase involved in cell wall biosynthesis